MQSVGNSTDQRAQDPQTNCKAKGQRETQGFKRLTCIKKRATPEIQGHTRR